MTVIKDPGNALTQQSPQRSIATSILEFFLVGFPDCKYKFLVKMFTFYHSSNRLFLWVLKINWCLNCPRLSYCVGIYYGLGKTRHDLQGVDVVSVLLTESWYIVLGAS